MSALRSWRPSGPGSFQAPPDVTSVRDCTGRLWTRTPLRTRWTSGGPNIRWRTLVAEHGPITEDTPT